MTANRRTKKNHLTLILLAVAILFFAIDFIITSFEQDSQSQVVKNSRADEVSLPTHNREKINKQIQQLSDSNLPVLANTNANQQKSRPPMPDIFITNGVSGEKAIKALGNDFAGVAAFYGKTESELTNILRHDSTIRLNAKGHIYFVDVDNHAHAQVAQQSSSVLPVHKPDERVLAGITPLDQTFLLHSKPGLSKIIYLDFDGFDATDTAWNTTNTPLIASNYDNDQNPSTFSESEQEEIANIWMLVANAFAPFNVDVTTEDPGIDALNKNDDNDTTFGVRVVITTDEVGTVRNRLCDNPGCIGTANLAAFEISELGPAWVFNKRADSIHGIDIENYMATTVIHEIGHAFGLVHDGLVNGDEYYAGHNNWVPVMGLNTGRYGAGDLVQWSKGEYTNANNKEDDIAIIAANEGVGYVADDFGNSAESATQNSASPSDPDGVSFWGIISNQNDTDFISFNVANTVTVAINLFSGYGMHADFTLYDSAGLFLAKSDSKYPFLVGAIKYTLVPGIYKLGVKGEGFGNPLTNGYSTYGSIGDYFVQILVDTDGDGVSDSIDTDDDNDKELDVNDAFPLDPTESTDSDNDGIGNNADNDDDNDGVPDQDDSYPFNANIYGVNGIAANDAFGSAVSYVGDVNNDSFGDYIVGAYLRNVGTLADAGSAYIISGKTGHTLFAFNGDSAKDYFGFSVAGVGDVDGDDVPDVMAGAYLDDVIVNGVNLTDAGSIKLFSGATGNLIYQVTGTSAKEYFGYALAGLHDVDGDGKGDIVVGAPQADKQVNTNTLRDAGKIQIFVGEAGTLYRTYYGDAAGDNLGKSVAVAGDLNNDSFEDVIAGAPLGDVMNTATLKLMKDAGYARIFSPHTDTILNSPVSLKGSLAGDNFGSSVSGAGDVNNDGTDDLIIGAFKADIFATKLMKDAGATTVFSGADWNVIHRFAGTNATDYVGSSVTGVGDINADGFADVAVGAYGFDATVPITTKKLSNAGKVTIYSGQNKNELFNLSGTAANDYFAWALSAGDTNNDNVHDVLIGVPKDDVIKNGAADRDAGSVTVISGSSLSP